MQQKPKTGTPWKIGLTVIGLLFFAATAATLFIANRRVSRVVDTEYYSRGLHYAETHRRSGNSGSEWTTAAAVVGHTLQVMVLDAAGSPVTGGRMVYELDLPEGSRAGFMELLESKPGTYAVKRPNDLGTKLRGTIRFTRGDATITGRLAVIN